MKTETNHPDLKITPGFKAKMLVSLLILQILRLVFAIFMVVMYIIFFIPMIFHKETFRKKSMFFARDISDFNPKK
jgi:hypothetical protein